MALVISWALTAITSVSLDKGDFHPLPLGTICNSTITYTILWQPLSLHRIRNLHVMPEGLPWRLWIWWNLAPLVLSSSFPPPCLLHDLSLPFPNWALQLLRPVLLLPLHMFNIGTAGNKECLSDMVPWKFKYEGQIDSQLFVLILRISVVGDWRNKLQETRRILFLTHGTLSPTPFF